MKEKGAGRRHNLQESYVCTLNTTMDTTPSSSVEDHYPTFRLGNYSFTKRTDDPHPSQVTTSPPNQAFRTFFRGQARRKQPNLQGSRVQVMFNGQGTVSYKGNKLIQVTPFTKALRDELARYVDLLLADIQETEDLDDKKITMSPYAWYIESGEAAQEFHVDLEEGQRQVTVSLSKQHLATQHIPHGWSGAISNVGRATIKEEVQHLLTHEVHLNLLTTNDPNPMSYNNIVREVSISPCSMPEKPVLTLSS